ncbi:hypothetical protein HGRIS_013209 [Hohenbuehelia grisea]|uniref:BTB domain-containing protein n=1 Tax=Hohenbuehelia grisea TaxID=104357 RepID=A0ABR3IUY3_9AGAR
MMSTSSGFGTAVNGHSTPVSNGSTSRDPEQYANDDNTPSTSTHTNGYSIPQHQVHNEEILKHLYHSGFQTGNYADTTLHVHQNVYRLHAIILSRSPYLAHLMSTSPQGNGARTIFVHLEQEPEITPEGFSIALGYLYSAVSLNAIRLDNARSVLAAGSLLGGMDDLCQVAYETCQRSLSVETIGHWLEFVDSLPGPADGTSTPEPSHTVFGPYAQRLRDDVFHFLIVTLPDILEVQKAAPPPAEGQGPSGRDVLLQIFSRVPFEMFKAAVESPSFQIGSDQARFKFAKEAIEMRKNGIARGHGAEETVVLAFGGGNFGGSAVHVTRKLRKRPLWKVNS